MTYPDFQDPETLRGTVERITFRNSDTGYSVIQISVGGKRERCTVVGVCADVRLGSEVIAQGTFIEHPKFGRQFSLTQLSEAPPSSSDGLVRFLSSGTIEGVGKRTAEKLVDALGKDAISIISQDIDRVAAIPGVGHKRAEALHEALKATSIQAEAFRFLIENGVSASLAGKIFERFKQETLTVVRKNPYLLAKHIRGIGFLTADGIAMQLGIAHDAPERLKAGVLHALEQSVDDGHCCIFRDDLKKRAQVLLTCEEYALEQSIQLLLDDGEILLEYGALFLPHIEQAERYVADWITQHISESRLRRDGSEAQGNDNAEKLLSSLRAAERELKVTLSPEQRLVVQSVMEAPLTIVTGGPGCGKTTVIKAITLFCQHASLSYVLAAPTGRAAQRMASVCDTTASTIHRLLRYDPHRNRFVHNEDEPLPQDVIIIDEASMVDILLARDLFRAVGNKARIVLVGDKDQLPSVGPGRVFADLVSCKDLPIISLSQLFRRSEESHITTIAHTINSGRVPEIPRPGTGERESLSDAYFIERESPQETQATLEALVSDQIPKKFGIAIDKIAVLSPSNRGPLGTTLLNQRLQEKLNPRSRLSDYDVLTLQHGEFRRGDKVCQRVNNYKIHDAGVFNGDMGTIIGVDQSTLSADVELWDGRLIKYERSDIGQLSLSYCMTVHRSQGMEVPCVVLVIGTSHYTLLERQLLYTGITRAKQLLIIVGSPRALTMAIKRISSSKRETRLRERMCH